MFPLALTYIVIDTRDAAAVAVAVADADAPPRYASLTLVLEVDK